MVCLFSKFETRYRRLMVSHMELVSEHKLPRHLSDEPKTCSKWIFEKVLLFKGPSWDSNRNGTTIRPILRYLLHTVNQNDPSWLQEAPSSLFRKQTCPTTCRSIRFQLPEVPRCRGVLRPMPAEFQPEGVVDKHSRGPLW